MTRIALLTCCSEKHTKPAPANLLYRSPLFRLCLRYAEQLEVERTFVLSAKYGLIDIDAWINPYDVTLTTMTAAERRRWTEGVLEQLEYMTSPRQDHFTVLAGRAYRDDLVQHLPHHSVPMAGRGIGRQLRFLVNATRAGRPSFHFGFGGPAGLAGRPLGLDQLDGDGVASDADPEVVARLHPGV